MDICSRCELKCWIGKRNVSSIVIYSRNRGSHFWGKNMPRCSSCSGIEHNLHIIRPSTQSNILLSNVRENILPPMRGPSAFAQLKGTVDTFRSKANILENGFGNRANKRTKGIKLGIRKNPRAIWKRICLLVQAGLVLGCWSASSERPSSRV